MKKNNLTTDCLHGNYTDEQQKRSQIKLYQSATLIPINQAKCTEKTKINKSDEEEMKKNRLKKAKEMKEFWNTK